MTAKQYAKKNGLTISLRMAGLIVGISQNGFEKMYKRGSLVRFDRYIEDAQKTWESIIKLKKDKK